MSVSRLVPRSTPSMTTTAAPPTNKADTTPDATRAAVVD